MDYRFSLRYWFCAFFCILFGFHPLAQEREKLDSLNAVLNGTGPDTARVNALFSLSHLYSGIDDNKAFALAQQGLRQSAAIPDKKWIAHAYNRLGSAYDVKGIPDSATFFFLKALKIFEELGHRSGLAGVYQNIGVMHYYQKDFEKALQNYNRALLLRRETGEINYVAQLYNNMGSVMRRKKEYDSAIVFYRKALEIKITLNDKQSLAASYMNLSVPYQYKGDFDSAIAYVQKAIELDRQTGNDYDLASAYIVLGEIYLKLKNVKEARAYAGQALAIGQKLRSNELLFNTYEELALCDTLSGDHKSAFKNYVDAMYYRDEVYSEEKAKAIGRLQTFYETEKKDAEIKLLNADNELKNRQQKLLVAILLLSVILLGIALWAFRAKLKHNKVLARQKAEIENKTEQLKEQAAQIARLSSQMNPHFLFNALNSLQKFVLNQDEAGTLEYINQLSALMRSTLNNSTREYISLKEEADYLRLYLEFEKKLLGAGFSYDFNTHGLEVNNIQLPPMLIQPLVENAVKHGLAAKQGEKRVEINFEQEGALVKITIRDNGVGRGSAVTNGHQSRAMEITRARLVSEFEKQDIAIAEPLLINDLQDPRGTEVILRVPLLEEF